MFIATKKLELYVITLTFDQYETLKAVIGSEMIDKEIERMQGWGG